jgi:ribosomal protein L37E
MGRVGWIICLRCNRKRVHHCKGMCASCYGYTEQLKRKARYADERKVPVGTS